jgi:hypothetical protein
MEIKIIEKNVYGKILLYPFNETAHKFAKLLNVKTFTTGQLHAIDDLGYNVTNVTPKADEVDNYWANECHRVNA